MDIPPDTLHALLPSFALQTLVENAVRHGAAPRVEPTAISIAGRWRDDALRLEVRDTGDGASEAQLWHGEGTGLRRLRERLAALFGGTARLDVHCNGGCTATLVIPQRLDSASVPAGEDTG